MILYGATYGDGRFIAVGDYGAILTSGPAVRAGIPSLHPNNNVEFTLSGPRGQNCLVQTSSNLTVWTTVAGILLTNGYATFVDSAITTNSTLQFYRTMSQ
jgi:hypothetical protein